MTSYLLFQGYHQEFLAEMRSLCVLTGLLSTFTAGHLIRTYNQTKTGTIGLISLVLFMIPVTISVFGNERTVAVENVYYCTLFFGGILGSRWGIWTFDLAQMELLQIRYERLLKILVNSKIILFCINLQGV